jgi:hypothetical protein
MSVVLWPRQEVLQLVIPQLGHVGVSLTPNAVFEIMQKLHQAADASGLVT